MLVELRRLELALCFFDRPSDADDKLRRNLDCRSVPAGITSVLMKLCDAFSDASGPDRRWQPAFAQLAGPLDDALRVARRINRQRILDRFWRNLDVRELVVLAAERRPTLLEQRAQRADH